jgi:hypothetical protein
MTDSSGSGPHNMIAVTIAEYNALRAEVERLTECSNIDDATINTLRAEVERLTEALREMENRK